jgi:hypothetical protein
MKWLPEIPDLMSKKAAFLLFNTLSLVFVWWKGQIRSDWPSIIGLIVAFALMNSVAWWSSRNFPQWAKPTAKPDRDDTQPARKAIDTRSQEQ